MTTTTTPAPGTAAVRQAISSTPRPARPGPLTAALAFGWRGMLKVKHVPEQLLDVTVTPVMFVLMFTYLFGGAIAGSTSAYLDYILPGILVMSVLFTTVYSGVSLNTDLTKGVVDRFRSLPVWRPAPLLGSLLGYSVRYVIGGSVIIALGVALAGTARPGAQVEVLFRRPERTFGMAGRRGRSLPLYAVGQVVTAGQDGRWTTTFTADRTTRWYARSDGNATRLGTTAVR